jgi:DNA-binding transcriptional regulator YhcF (GntR family)
LTIPKQKSITINGEEIRKITNMNKSFMLKTQLRRQQIFSKKKFKEGFLESIEEEIFEKLKNKKLKKRYAQFLSEQNKLVITKEQWEEIEFFEGK